MLKMKMQAPTVSTYLSQKALSWQEHDSLHFASQFLSPNLAGILILIHSVSLTL